MEQRNGRITRPPARARDRCTIFFTQRPEDRVLQALVRKTDRIGRRLGSLSAVLERRLEQLLGGGISDPEVQVRAIDAAEADARDRQTVEEELEESRERRVELEAQSTGCAIS